MVSEPDIPSGYPYNSSYPHSNPPPPTVYPYPAQPADEGVSTGAVWEFNTGKNINEKGQQRGGDIKAGNTVAGSSTGLPFPQNGRFVFNTGNNINKGDVQKSGDIEFGNVFSNSH